MIHTNDCNEKIKIRSSANFVLINLRQGVLINILLSGIIRKLRKLERIMRKIE